MLLKVLKSEADYEAALNRVDALMGSSASSLEGQELEVWVKLIEIYEKELYPIEKPDPVEALKFRMEQSGLTQKDLANLLGSQSKASEVLSRKRPLSLTMIRTLHTKLGIPADVLLQSPASEIPPERPQFAELKEYISEMFRRGWFANFAGTLADAKENAEELIDRLLQPLSVEFPAAIQYRQHVRNGSQLNESALLAWRARVTALAMANKQVASYKPGSINLDFVKKLVGFSVANHGPLVVKEYLEKTIGVHLIIEKHLPKTHLDGAAFMLPSTGTPVIAMTIRYDRVDNFWFTLCHELGHIAKHLDLNSSNCYIDDLDLKGSDEWEVEADNFAMDALIPADVRRALDKAYRLPIPEVKNLAHTLQINPAIVAGYIRRKKNDYRLYSGLIGSKIIGRLFFNKPNTVLN